MSVERLDHVGIVVEDIEAASAFFAELGLESGGRGTVEGEWVGRVIGLGDVRSKIEMLRVPGGGGTVELVEFESPRSEEAAISAPANALGIRHLTFAVDDLDETLARLAPHGAELVGEVERYKDIYRLCYLRGPAGIIVELAEELG